MSVMSEREGALTIFARAKGLDARGAPSIHLELKRARLSSSEAGETTL
jgi:hypothetical protein